MTQDIKNTSQIYLPGEARDKILEKSYLSIAPIMKSLIENKFQSQAAQRCNLYVDDYGIEASKLFEYYYKDRYSRMNPHCKQGCEECESNSSLESKINSSHKGLMFDSFQNGSSKVDSQGWAFTPTNITHLSSKFNTSQSRQNTKGDFYIQVGSEEGEGEDSKSQAEADSKLFSFGTFHKFGDFDG